MTTTLINPTAIDPAVGFKHFPLCLTPAETKLFADAPIGEGGNYDNFSDLHKIAEDCKNFFGRLGASDRKAVAQSRLVEKLVRQIVASFEAQTGWLSLRVTVPSKKYNIPRWHVDGHYYAPFVGDQHKAVVTLKGPHTLLVQVTDAQRKALLEQQRLDTADARLIKADMLKSSTTTTASPGFGTLFITGSDCAAFHSEPPLTEDRIFLSVVPGSEEQIEELRRRWAAPHRNAYIYAGQDVIPLKLK